MRLKQEIKLRQHRAIMLAGIGVSVALIWGIFLMLNFGRIDQTKAEVNSVSVWTGEKNTDFSNPANWSTNQVPDISTKAVIETVSKKTIELKRNDHIAIGELELKGGAQLSVKGDLEVRKDVIVHSVDTRLTVEGKLLVAQSLFALSNGQVFFNKGAKAFIDYDVIIENALIENSGANIEIERNLEIRRYGSSFIQNAGSTQIQFNMLLFGSAKTSNAFVIKGGSAQVFGAVNYLKENDNARNVGSLSVIGGSMVVNQVARNTVNDFYLPTKMNLEIKGGELIFKNDLNFDTLNLENSVVKYGDGALNWKDDKVYKRKEINDILKVSYSDKVYYLKQSIWSSEGDQPGTSANWLYLGKMQERDPSCNCLNVQDWDKSKTYTREDSDQEIFVNYDGTIYRMNKTATYSKSNTPTNNTWAWIKWFDCPKNQQFYNDVLHIEGGKVVFEGAWYHREGVTTEEESIIELAEGNTEFTLLDGDVISNLNILRDARLNIKGKAQLVGDINNHSELSIGDGGILELNGNREQSLKGSLPLVFKNLQLNKDSKAVYAYNNLIINDTLIWKTPTAIKLQNATNSFSSRVQTVFVFSENANYKGIGWIEGSVRKEGSSEFIFPVGAYGKAGPISLSKPAIKSSYTVNYKVGYPPYLNSTSNGVSTISALEYWQVETDYGDNAVVPTVFWMNAQWSCIENPEDLVVAGFNSSVWTSIGNRFYKDKEELGSVTAQKGISKMQYFTFGSTGNSNPLNSAEEPFTVSKTENGFNLNWSDKPNKPYSIELIKEDEDGAVSLKSWKVKSQEAQMQLDLQEELAFENTYTVCVLTDNKIWRKPLINSNEIDEIKIDVYPNPFVNQFSIHFVSDENETATWSLIDGSGRTVYSASKMAIAGENTFKYTNAESLEPGNYLVQVIIGNKRISKSIIKN